MLKTTFELFLFPSPFIIDGHWIVIDDIPMTDTVTAVTIHSLSTHKLLNGYHITHKTAKSMPNLTSQSCDDL